MLRYNLPTLISNFSFFSCLQSEKFIKVDQTTSNHSANKSYQVNTNNGSPSIDNWRLRFWPSRLEYLFQVRAKGISSAPIQFSAYWRCDDEQTDLKLEYKYNASSMSSAVSLNNVSVVVPVDGGVTIMQSKPTATWLVFICNVGILLPFSFYTLD